MEHPAVLVREKALFRVPQLVQCAVPGENPGEHVILELSRQTMRLGTPAVTPSILWPAMCNCTPRNDSLFNAVAQPQLQNVRRRSGAAMSLVFLAGVFRVQQLRGAVGDGLCPAIRDLR